MRKRGRSGVAIAALSAAVALPALAAVHIGVLPIKLIVVDKLATSGKAKVVFVAKSVGGPTSIGKGDGTDASQINAVFDVRYTGENGLAAGSFVLPAGARDGTDGWTNTPSVAKYVNTTAPGGETGTKAAVVKSYQLVKIVGKSLGDVALDVVAAGPPTSLVRVTFEVTNGTEVLRHCADVYACSYELIAGATGAKLVCKHGYPDYNCLGVTDTTTSTLPTTTSTTVPPIVCCDSGTTAAGSCGHLAPSTCALGGAIVRTPGTVCDATSGLCGAPPGGAGDCCETFAGCVAGPSAAAFCTAYSGLFVPGAVCLPSGECAP